MRVTHVSRTLRVALHDPSQLTPRRPRSEPQVLIFGLADLRTGAESQRYTRMS